MYRGTDSWLQTVNGNRFNFLNPRPDEIFVEDIAWALSMQCRFAGHCLEFYSVAEHCIHTSNLVEPEFALWGLLHDASEAYLCDIPRPLKQIMPEYLVIEEKIMQVIAKAFDLSWPIPKEVKEVDTKLLFTEREAILTPTEYEWENEQKGYPSRIIQCWDHYRAYAAFMHRFNTLRSNYAG